MARIAPIGHEDRLSIVEHLDELRTRLIVCIAAVIVCFCFTYWQKDHILHWVNRPFENSQHLQDAKRNPDSTKGNSSVQITRSLQNTANAVKESTTASERTVQALTSLDARQKLAPQTSLSISKAVAAVLAANRAADRAERTIPKNLADKPTTLGVTEPFITTFTVAGYAALLLSLPLILYQLYAFLLPAFSPKERRVAVPFMAMVPVLFVCGVAFCYFVALPRAVNFLLNFNSDSFNILVGAQQYYKFSIILMAAVGLLFQIPVGVLAITRLGILTPQQMAKNRGYVILVIAIVAAVATPTPDPVTMLVTMAPLVVLFELSLILARIFKPKEGEGLFAGRFDGWGEDDDDDDPDDDPWDDDDPDPFGLLDQPAEPETERVGGEPSA